MKNVFFLFPVWHCYWEQASQTGMHFPAFLVYTCDSVTSSQRLEVSREKFVISGWDFGEEVCFLRCPFPLLPAQSGGLQGPGEVVSTFAVYWKHLESLKKKKTWWPILMLITSI